MKRAPFFTPLTPPAEQERSEEGVLAFLRGRMDNWQQVESPDQIDEPDEEIAELLEGTGLDELGEAYEVIEPFDDPGPNVLRRWDEGDRYLAQMIDAAADEMEDVKREQVHAFGEEVFARMPESVQGRLLNNLETGKKGHKPGKDLYRIAKNATYLEYFGDPVDALDNLLFDREPSGPVVLTARQMFRQGVEEFFTSGLSVLDEGRKYVKAAINGAGLYSSEFDPVLSVFSRGSPYKDALDELFEEYWEDISYVASLAEEAGIDRPTFAVEQKMKNYEGQKKYLGREREIDDMDGLRELMEEDLATKKRAYTIQAIEYMGEEAAFDRYEEVMGERPEDLSADELEVLRAYDEYGKNRDAAKALLEHGDGVYDLPANQAWLERTGFDVEDLTEFESRGYKALVGGARSEVTVRVASPLESIQMGNHFTGSCLAIGKSNGWGAVANAIDVNKQVLYAEDEEGEVVGRIMTAITEDDVDFADRFFGDQGRHELSMYSPYAETGSSSFQMHDILEEAVKEYGDHLDLVVTRGDTDVATLEADEWYDRGI